MWILDSVGLFWVIRDAVTKGICKKNNNTNFRFYEGCHPVLGILPVLG